MEVLKQITFKSTEVATALSKRHDNFLRDIQALLVESFDDYSEEGCEFVHKQFEPSTYRNRGRDYPSFEITQTGLTLLLPQYQCKEAKNLFLDFLRTITPESES